MKIGILTQPLHNNYGGILQAYALQKVLKDMGHKVWTINREYTPSGYDRFMFTMRRLLVKLFHKEMSIPSWQVKEKGSILRYIRAFVEDNIQTTEEITSTKQLSSLHRKYAFDAYIVGSDQVWRPKYSPCITNYFLDFIENDCTIKKIAYAASFGEDKWEFTKRQTQKCARLAKQFHAISVREDSAIRLCNNYLGVDALHVLDPTMLLDKEDYIALINKGNTHPTKGNLFVYILDKNKNKYNIVAEIAKSKNLIPFEITPKKLFYGNHEKGIEKYIYPSVAQWLRAFLDAEFIITDSYHGTVFSIIFHKCFLTFGNRRRGLSRFKSLLNLLDIQKRLILDSYDIVLEELSQGIDYDSVEKILEKEKNKSLSFLNHYISSDTGGTSTVI